MHGCAEWGWGGLLSATTPSPSPPPRDCVAKGNSQPFPGEEELLLPRIFIKHGKVGPAPSSGGPFSASRGRVSAVHSQFTQQLKSNAPPRGRRPLPRRGAAGRLTAGRDFQELIGKGASGGGPVGYWWSTASPHLSICPRVRPRSPHPVPAPFLHPPVPGWDAGGAAPRCPGRGGPVVVGRSGDRTGRTAPSGQRCAEESGAPGVQRSIPGRSGGARGFSGAAQRPLVLGAGPAMPSYPQRTLTVLLLFGTLSAVMALLASSLIFQLPAGRTALGSGPGAVRGALPESAAAVLLPVSAVLAALCLVLNVSCLLLCLLHGYFSTELCRGQPGPER